MLNTFRTLSILLITTALWAAPGQAEDGQSEGDLQRSLRAVVISLRGAAPQTETHRRLLQSGLETLLLSHAALPTDPKNIDLDTLENELQKEIMAFDVITADTPQAERDKGLMLL